MPDAVKTRQRDRVRDLLAASDVGLDATEVSDALGIHVTSARFHLNNMVADGTATTEQLAPEGVGRPRVAYRLAPPAAAASLGALLLTRLGPTATAREDAAAAAGRAWARTHRPATAQTALADPVLVVHAGLTGLGLDVTDVVSDLESHRITVCTRDLSETACGLPEVVRGTVRGAAEEALETIADTFGIGYLVQATTVDDETVTLRLTERPLLQGSLFAD